MLHSDFRDLSRAPAPAPAGDLLQSCAPTRSLSSVLTSRRERSLNFQAATEAPTHVSISSSLFFRRCGSDSLALQITNAVLSPTGAASLLARRGSLSRLTQGSPRRPAGAVLRNWQLADAARLSDHQMRDGWVDGELEMR